MSEPFDLTWDCRDISMTFPMARLSLPMSLNMGSDVRPSSAANDDSDVHTISLTKAPLVHVCGLVNKPSTKHGSRAYHSHKAVPDKQISFFRAWALYVLRRAINTSEFNKRRPRWDRAGIH
jgi:hypothetical protein